MTLYCKGSPARPLQWHPAFYAGLQIELTVETVNLIFENEHQLGTKPKEIDVLIIKKDSDAPIHKNIGRIFRKHNIVEYKRPSDSLTIDDFYRVLGYACFYKADTENENAIPFEEITITLVCSRYPRKLIQHLTDARNLTLRNVEDGIYYLEGELFPVQLILTKQLNPEQNLWLRALTDGLHKPHSTGITEMLIKQYQNHRENPLYQSAMNLIVRANRETFKEGDDMCEALRELVYEMFPDELEEGYERGRALGIEQGIEAIVHLCKDMKLPFEEAVARISQSFSLTPDESLQFAKTYWEN